MIAAFLLHCLCSALIITVAHNQLNAEGSRLMWLTSWMDIVLDYLGLIFISKPLYACLICMSSVWGGTSFYLISRLFAPQFGLLETVCAVPVIGGIMVIVSCVVFLRENQDSFEQNERL